MTKAIKPPKMVVIPEKKVVKQEKSEVKDSYTTDPRPTFSVSELVYPKIKDWKTGQKYKMEIEVEQVGSEISDWGDDKGKMVNRFKICGIAAEEKSESSDYPSGMTKGKK